MKICASGKAFPKLAFVFAASTFIKRPSVTTRMTQRCLESCRNVMIFREFWRSEFSMKDSGKSSEEPKKTFVKLKRHFV